MIAQTCCLEVVFYPCLSLSDSTNISVVLGVLLPMFEFE